MGLITPSEIASLSGALFFIIEFTATEFVNAGSRLVEETRVERAAGEPGGLGKGPSPEPGILTQTLWPSPPLFPSQKQGMRALVLTRVVKLLPV